MERFQNGKRFSESEFTGEKNPYAEASAALREVLRGVPSIDKDLRKNIFDRMLQGPDLAPADPSLEDIFEQIAAVEAKYGQERVAELATFYVTPEGIGT